MGVKCRNRFPEIMRQAQPNADDAVDQTVRQIEASAKQRVPVDTGYLRSTIEAGDGKVTVGADYARYVEFGTRRAGAQPFLVPAAEQARKSFAKRAGKIYE